MPKNRRKAIKTINKTGFKIIILFYFVQIKSITYTFSIKFTPDNFDYKNNYRVAKQSIINNINKYNNYQNIDNCPIGCICKNLNSVYLFIYFFILFFI